MGRIIFIDIIFEILRKEHPLCCQKSYFRFWNCSDSVILFFSHFHFKEMFFFILKERIKKIY